MREALTADSLQSFMKALAVDARTPSRVYLVGGASAVLLGWRNSTIDVDLKIIPESDEILRALPRLKERLHINIELASPDDFIPELPGWQERSRFIQQESKLSFYHYDFYGRDEKSDPARYGSNAGFHDVELSDNASARGHFHFPAVPSQAWRKTVARHTTE